MPGLAALRRYHLGSDFNSDLFDCVLVEVVALPVSIAYAKFAGMSPAVGLYANLGPPLAHELFGMLSRFMATQMQKTARSSLLQSLS